MEKKFKQYLPQKPKITEVDVIETQGLAAVDHGEREE